MEPSITRETEIGGMVANLYLSQLVNPLISKHNVWNTSQEMVPSTCMRVYMYVCMYIFSKICLRICIPVSRHLMQHIYI